MGHRCYEGAEVEVLQNMASGHIKVKKGSGYVFYMGTPSHATESVQEDFRVEPSAYFVCRIK